MPTSPAGLQQPDRTTEELATEICSLAAQISAASCRWLELVAEFDRRHGWSGAGILSCAHWLSWRCGISLHTAYQQVRVAHALEEFEPLRELFAAGRISYSKARAIARVADRTTIDSWCQLALSATAAQLDRAARAGARVIALSGPPVQPRAYWRSGEDGMIRLHAVLRPEDAALVEVALAAFTAAPPSAAALAEGDDSPDSSERAADALLSMAQAAITAHESSGTARNPSARADRQLVIVHRHPDCDGERAHPNHPVSHLQHGDALDAGTTDWLGCDAVIQQVVDDDDGYPRLLGPATRSVPPRIRRSVLLRDGAVCRFPGCTNQYVDVHHIQPLADGGPTVLENLITICRRHHRMIHMDGFQIRPEGAKEFLFLTPASRVIPAVPDPVETSPMSYDPGVEPDALVPVNGDARMDLHYVIAGIFQEPARAN